MFQVVSVFLVLIFCKNILQGSLAMPLRSGGIFTAALCNRAGHYIFALWFLSSSSFFYRFSSPNLSSRRLYVYHTSTHGVALVQIYNAFLKRAARGSLEIQDAKNRHFGTIAQLCWAISSELRHVSTIGKKTC